MSNTSKTLAVFAVLLVGAAEATMLAKQIAARSLAAASLPDPHCKTGVISMKVSGKPQSCCAGYCGACNDYKTCASVRGQDSENACCASKVYEMRCGNAPANICLKTCSESVPPCIMDVDLDNIEIPKVKNVKGVPGCNDVVPFVRSIHKNALDKGDLLSDLHVASTRLEEARTYAQASKVRIQRDLQDPDIPDDHKAKMEQEAKNVEQVIGFVSKHEALLKKVKDKVSALKAGHEIPHEVRPLAAEVLDSAGMDDKNALQSSEKSTRLHYDAYMMIAGAARKAADAAAAKQAAAELAARKAAQKAAEEKAKRDAEAAKKAAAEAAAAAAAAAKAAKEAAAAAAAKAKKARLVIKDDAEISMSGNVKELGDLGISGNDPRTVMFWMKANVADGNMPVMFSMGNWGTTCGVFDLKVQGSANGCIALMGYRCDHYPQASQGCTKPVDGKWHHVAAVYDGSVLKMFTDGVQETQKTVKFATPAGTVARFGGGHGYSFKGGLKGLYVYARALTTKEVETLFLGGNVQ